MPWEDEILRRTTYRNFNFIATHFYIKSIDREAETSGRFIDNHIIYNSVGQA
jgi:hypothetical protein